MTNNQRVLARIRAEGLISRAKRPITTSPAHATMAALAEAIAEKQARLQELLATGRSDTDEYRALRSTLDRWTSAWKQNR
jgi:hypothetical protein